MEENRPSDTASRRNDLEGMENRAGRRRTWSVDETAEQLGISRAHAYELIARREIPHLRLGRRIVVPTSAIDDLIERALRLGE